MKSHDLYEPRWKKQCPRCLKPLDDWKGLDGPCNFFAWQQHKTSPIKQIEEADYQLSFSERNKARLPESFRFTTQCKACETFVKAEGVCADGVWRYTFIRTPDVPYPSGEGHPLFRLNVKIDGLAKRCGTQTETYEEDGLGTHTSFHFNLDFGASIVFEQSQHLSNKNYFGEKTHKGPTAYVDAFDAIKFGYEKLYWGVLNQLNIPKSAVDAEFTDMDEWQKDARKLFENAWNYWDNK